MLNRKVKSTVEYQNFIDTAMSVAYNHQMPAGIDRGVLEKKVAAIVRARRGHLGQLTKTRKKVYSPGKKCGRPGVLFINIFYLFRS